jgi:hypothetical protein
MSKRPYDEIFRNHYSSRSLLEQDREEERKKVGEGILKKVRFLVFMLKVFN